MWKLFNISYFNAWIIWKLFNTFYSNVEIMWKLFNISYHLHSILSIISKNHYSWFYLSFLHFSEITWNQSYFLHMFRFHFCFKTINIHDVSKIFFKNRVFVKKIHLLLLSRIQQSVSSSTRIWSQKFLLISSSSQEILCKTRTRNSIV